MSILSSVQSKLVRATTAAAHVMQASRAVRASQLPLQDDLVFVDSRNGLDLAGNILRLMVELRQTYGSTYRIVTAATRERRAFVRGMLDAYGFEDVPIRRYLGGQYFRDLARARYILTDVTLPHPYMKREGQIILNTWHGTPLKRMGFDSPTERAVCDNIQRNLLMADYLLFPSEYCLDVMAEAYSLRGLYAGRVLLEGYPRNEVFFDATAAQSVRERFGLADKRVYVYMPTWRQPKDSVEAGLQTEAFAAALQRIDALLQDGEVLYLRLHDLAQKALAGAVRGFLHIMPYPTDIEAYEFLACADCLVTDYSSVLYDYANAPGKIVLYAYDEDAYREGRGLYTQPVLHPFPKVSTAEALVDELRAPKLYDDSLFRHSYCSYDGPGATRRIVQAVFGGTPVANQVHLGQDELPVVLMYGGGYERNGITTSLLNLMAAVPDDMRYVLAYSAKQMRGHEQDLDVLPNARPKLCVTGSFRCATPLELAGIAAYYLAGIDAAPTRSLVERYYAREARRCFALLDLRAVVQFVGYERFMIGLLQRAQGRRAIWLHNDMRSETQSKGHRDFPMLKWAYESYDQVVCVGNQLVPIAQSLGASKDRISVVENCQDFDRVRERSHEAIAVEAETVVDLDGHADIEQFLDAYEHTFVTIGRFSPEKDHELLIRAFERFCACHEGCGLIIIGGYGPSYEQTLACARASAVSASIMVIRNIANPMPILARCELFLLSSHYEGKPMVLAEAAALNLPVAVVDAPGCREFVEEGGGLVVVRSAEGLAEAMEASLIGEVPPLRIDFTRYREGAVESFLRVIRA